MSTSLSQVRLTSSWKQEVNQRIAAHKSRKGAGGGEPEAAVETHHSVSRRATEAAARVVARFAHSPSYDEMLASEARAALRAAEAASKAALEAQAAAASVLAGIEAAVGSQQTSEAHVSPRTIDATEEEDTFEEAFSDLPRLGLSGSTPPATAAGTPELPALPEEPTFAQAAQAPGAFAASADKWPAQAWPAADGASAEEIAIVEPSQPIRGNLIQFPRELVATRKARPRRAEGAYAAPEAGTQLSIFEVDPGAISTQPEAEAGALDEAAQPAWTAPEWSGIEFEAQPEVEADTLLEEPAIEAAPFPAIEPARVSLRLLAAVVDAALILAAVLAAAVVAAHNAKGFPSMREAWLCAGLALLVAAAAYEALFLTLGQATPGMKYAQISLCTIDSLSPTLAQKRRRLAALLLSVLPVGLGFAWVLFDDNRLTWHDRLSETYPREN